MSRLGFGLLSFAGTAVLAVSVAAQPGPDRDRDPGPPPGRQAKGPPGGPPPRFQLGKVLPPFVMHEIDLSDEQRKQLDELEADVRERLNKILTAEQKARIQTIRPPFPPPPPQPRDGDRPPPRGGERRPPSDDDTAAPPTW